MKHLFIINPAAGRADSTKQLELLLEQLSFEHEVVYTEKPGDACRLARQAAACGEPVRLYACGGDGTLNEVVNGAAGYDNAAVTCVPKGTGNDFLKLFGPDWRTQFYDLEALATGPQTPFDLIDCNGMLGIDVVCAGFDARVGVGVHRYKRLRFVSGFGAYFLSLIEQAFKGLSHPMRGQSGQYRWEGQTTLLCVCNGRYYGGGFMPMPEALPDDGVLDMLIIKKVGLFRLAGLVSKYFSGRYRELPAHLFTACHGQEITFSSDTPITVSVDGEAMSDHSFCVRLSDKKVNFFYPEYAHYAVEFSTPQPAL